MTHVVEGEEENLRLTVRRVSNKVKDMRCEYGCETGDTSGCRLDSGKSVAVRVFPSGPPD